MEYQVDIDATGSVLTSQLGNGSKKQQQVITKIEPHSNVVQYTIPLEEEEIEGQRVKTKSNIKNDRMAGPGIKILNISVADLDGDGISEKMVGAAFVPGGSVVSSVKMPGDPIPGLDVKLGKNPGGQMIQNSGTNENGEFEFTKLDAGEYRLIVEQTIVFNDETAVWIGNDAAARRGDVRVVASQNSQSLRTGGPDEENAGKIKSNPMPVKWAAPESLKTAINNSHSNIKNLLAAIEDVQTLLNSDGSSNSFAINNSHSNIKNLLVAVYDLQSAQAQLQFFEKDVAMDQLNTKAGNMSRMLNILQESLTSLGGRYSSISNVLKTRHDVAMNAIRNMK